MKNRDEETTLLCLHVPAFIYPHLRRSSGTKKGPEAYMVIGKIHFSIHLLPLCPRNWTDSRLYLLHSSEVKLEA